MMSMSRPIALVATVAAVAGAAFVGTGCGISLDGSADEPSVDRARLDARASERRANLPPRPAGVIRVDGKGQGSLTADVVDAYNNEATGVTVDVQGDDEEEAFNLFCQGEVDIVDSARPISPREYEQCRRNGIRPVQIQLASDAAVLAIRNETDVGVDCLTLAEVREIFRAGSPIDSWAQVGYGKSPRANWDAPPMKTAGPDPESNVFGFFGRFVLDDPEPSLTAFRSDYQAYPTDRGVRLAVVGSEQDIRDARKNDASRAILEGQLKALRDADRAVREAEAEVRKGIRDDRPAAAQARDQERLDKAKQKYKEIDARLPELRLNAINSRKAARRLAKAIGTLGYFRFSYYESFEEQLRPMEIDDGARGDQPNCIFPSQQTVTDGSFPLARQLLLTTSLRLLRQGDINSFLSYAVRSSQRLAADRALVPLPDTTRDVQMSWISGESAPDVIYYPPSGITVPTASGNGGGGDDGDNGDE